MKRRTILVEFAFRMMRIVAALEAGTGVQIMTLAQLAGVFWWAVLRGRRIRRI